MASCLPYPVPPLITFERVERYVQDIATISFNMSQVNFMVGWQGTVSRTGLSDIGFGGRRCLGPDSLAAVRVTTHYIPRSMSSTPTAARQRSCIHSLPALRTTTPSSPTISTLTTHTVTSTGPKTRSTMSATWPPNPTAACAPAGMPVIRYPRAPARSIELKASRRGSRSQKTASSDAATSESTKCGKWRPSPEA